ncbi:hypothetical protein MWG46_03285 [Escherichia coli]|nr:hypothetical protein [Escherichia coli]
MTRLTVGWLRCTYLICLIPEFMRDAMKVRSTSVDITAYRCCRDYGLYGSSANSDDVQSVMSLH